MPPIVNRLARLLPHVCLLLAILVPATAIAIMALIPVETFLASLKLSASPLPEFGWEQRSIAALILLLPSGCLSYALMKARSSLRRFNRGDYFSASAIRDIRGFGAGIFWSGMVKFAVWPLVTLVVTGMYSARSLLMGLGTSTLVMLTIGGILWQIASMMQRAAELAEENRQFV